MYRSKPEIYLWMTASIYIIGCIGLQSVKYERLHSLLWGVFHNWTKPWSFIYLWKMSSIFGGRQQIWQQSVKSDRHYQVVSNVEFQISSILAKTLQNSFVWEIFIGWWYINHVMWSATDSCLHLNQNGSLCFVKMVRNELQTRSKFSSCGPHLSKINLRRQHMGCEVLSTVFLGWIYAKENTVSSFFNLHVRKLSNGPMNFSWCQFCTFSHANAIMSHTVSHVLVISRGGSHIHVLYGEVPRFSPPFLKPISSTIGYGFLTLWATALLGGISN